MQINRAARQKVSIVKNSMDLSQILFHFWICNDSKYLLSWVTLLFEQLLINHFGQYSNLCSCTLHRISAPAPLRFMGRLSLVHISDKVDCDFLSPVDWRQNRPATKSTVPSTLSPARSILSQVQSTKSTVRAILSPFDFVASRVDKIDRMWACHYSSHMTWVEINRENSHRNIQEVAVSLLLLFFFIPSVIKIPRVKS